MPFSDSDDDFVEVANSSGTDEELSLSDASTPQQAVREKVRGLEDDYKSSPKKQLLIEDDKEEDPLAITVVTGKSQTIEEEKVKEDEGKEEEVKEDEVKEDPFTERQSPIMVLDDDDEEEMEEEAEDEEDDEDVEENEVERIPNEFEGMTQVIIYQFPAISNYSINKVKVNFLPLIIITENMDYTKVSEVTKNPIYVVNI